MGKFIKCKKCFHITNKQKKLKLVCPNCDNNLENEWVEYPPYAALGFLEQASAEIYGSDDFDIFTFHVLQSGCLFLCALYEVLLENLVYDILLCLGTNRQVIEIVINSNQGQDKLSKIPHVLSDVSLKDVMNAVGNTSFYDCMKSVIKGRNQYIHGDFDAYNNLEKQQLEYLCENIIGIFVSIQNFYITQVN